MGNKNSLPRKSISNILNYEYNFEDDYLNDEFDTCVELRKCKNKFFNRSCKQKCKNDLLRDSETLYRYVDEKYCNSLPDFRQSNCKKFYQKNLDAQSKHNLETQKYNFGGKRTRHKKGKRNTKRRVR